MNITVYLGAFEGNDPALADEVKKLGTWIGESGHSLIYGGSKSGLMGVIAESVLEAGGDVTGVEPQLDRKSTRLNSSHRSQSRMPSSA